jgi:hypothetical protein
VTDRLNDEGARPDTWQVDEQIALDELARGEGREFDNPEDAVRWLTEPEDLPASMLRPATFDDSLEGQASCRYVNFEPVDESEDLW